MANVFDVAGYILHRLGEDGKLPVTTWKLQKLVFYSQAWSLVWDDEPLFSEKFRAWANGPVCPDLYEKHRGRFQISELPKELGDGDLSADQAETIDVVLAHYASKSAQYLSELTHREQPWIDARGTLSAGVRGNSEITWDSMAEYYGGLSGVKT
jgi:uncharacterized phage-associated protein